MAIQSSPSLLYIFFHLNSAVPLRPDRCDDISLTVVSLLSLATPDSLHHLFLHVLELLADPLISRVDPQSDLQVCSGLAQVPQEEEDLRALLVGCLVHWVDLETLLAIEEHVVQKAQDLVGACHGEKGRRGQ